MVRGVRRSYPPEACDDGVDGFHESCTSVRAVGLTVALLLVAAACGGSDDDATNESTDDPAATQSGDPAAPDPAIISGGLATGVLTLDGRTVEYVTVTPEGFEVGDTAPVVIAFPPGGQDPELTRSVVEGTYLDEALARGWVVVSPAAPLDDSLWFEASETLSSELLDWVEGWVVPEGDRFHVIGVSNGGLSTFRVAGDHPDRVMSIVVFPGYPRSDADREALGGLSGIPVRMFVGGEDATWIGPMEDTDAALLASGGDVELEIVPGAGHIIAELSNGVRIFDELDAAR
jgi:pimeloyl-ACP methyl ester carboxylesterase